MAGGLNLSERESAYYQNLFSLADVEGHGIVGGDGAFNCFTKSGLDLGVLKQVWDIADYNQAGSIGFDAFSAALRLIGHAQAGQMVSPDAVYHEPTQLPQFEGIPLPNGGGMASFGGSGPNIAGSPFNTHQSLNLGDVPRGRPRQRGADSPTPTSRDCRKYARLFLKIDSDQDGHVSAMEAQELFARSGLDQGVLHQVWEISDADKDGYLNWPEFVLAMHLVRRARTNVPLPQGGLPNELVMFLGSVEQPHALAAQHSASRRSLSPGAFSTATSAGDASWGPSTFRGHQGGDQFDGGMPSFGNDFATQGNGFDNSGAGNGFDNSGGFNNPGGFGLDNNSGGFGQETTPGFGLEGDMGTSHKSKKDKRRQKHERDDQDFNNQERDFYDSSRDIHDRGQEQLPAPRDDPTSRLESRLDSGFDFGKSSPKHRSRGSPHHDDGYSPDFGQRSRRELPSPPRHDAPPVEHFEVLVEADKVIINSLRRDVDELDEELSRLEEACRFEERETARERVECDRIGQERENLRQQLAASQRQMNELKEEHQGIVLENVMLRCDHDHFAKESAFLKRLLDEATRDAQALQQSIEYLEQSNTSIRAHTKTLEDARNEVLETVKHEKELLRKEQREADFAKQALEALRIDGVDGLMRISGMRPRTDLRSGGYAIPSDGVQLPRGAKDQLQGGGVRDGFGTSGFNSAPGNSSVFAGGSQPRPGSSYLTGSVRDTSRLPGTGARIPVNSSQREGV
jgi:hypothetical protein